MQGGNRRGDVIRVRWWCTEILTSFNHLFASSISKTLLVVIVACVRIVIQCLGQDTSCFGEEMLQVRRNVEART